MLLNPLTQSIRRILFVRSDWLTKAEQLGLFDMPVLVKPHVKNGKVVRAYNRIQKKRLHPAPQAELFGDAPPKTESAKLGRLGHFIEKHGGYKRLYATLQGFTDAQRDTLLASMAKLAGKTPEAVLDILKTGAKHEVEPPQGDLFADKPKDKTPIVIPEAVRRELDFHINRFATAAQKLRDARNADAQFNGGGRYASEVWDNAKLDDSLKTARTELERLLGSFNDRNRAAAQAYLDERMPKPDEITLTQQERDFFGKGKSTTATNNEPREGDTKTENGIEYRLQDGRWHRVTPEQQEFRYALVNRPAGFAQVPDGYTRVDPRPELGQDHHEYARHGIVVYPRKLSSEEVYKWELSPILEGPDLNEFAQKIADKYDDDDAAYIIKMLDDEPGIVRQQFMNDMQRVGKDYGRTPSVGDINAFVDRIISVLRNRVAPQDTATFQPTHELPDGTQVVAHADDPGVWVDAQGDEYESDEAYPVRADDPVRNAAQSALNEAKEQGVITPQEHQAATDALESDGPGAAKAAIERKRKADKLRKTAQTLMDKARAAQEQERQVNTARRASIANNILARAAREEATAETMLNLADAIEAGEAPHLIGMNSMAAVQTLDAVLNRARLAFERAGKSLAELGEDVVPFVTWPDTTIRPDWIPSLQNDLRQVRGGKGLADEIRFGNLTQDLYDRMVKLLGEQKVNGHVGWSVADRLKDVARLKRAGITGREDLQDAVREYLRFRTGRKTIDPVKAAELALAGQQVGVDFFPTPKPLADRMADLADIEPGMKVLEPSAGKGNLADAAKAKGADVDVVEVSDALRNVLNAKGYALVDRDFNDYDPGEVYDRIIMNPPFGKGNDRRDAAHIQHAYDLLKPGGKLVAIAGEGVFFGSDQTAVAFRDWLNQRGAMVEKLPDNSFMDRAETHTTGAATRLVVIEKPAKQADDGPQEGDRNADGLVFHNGRWHRDQDAENPNGADAVEPDRMPFSPENHIKIAADDVTRLRADDVYRLFEELPKDAEAFDDLRVYLINERLDLAATVMDAIDEVGMPDRVRKDELSDADEAAKLADSHAQADRIRDYLANGGAVQLVNPRRILTLNSPDHIKKTASGVSIVEGRDSKSPDGYRWVSLFPDQVVQLAAQVPDESVKMKTYDWDAGKLANAYTLEELETLQAQTKKQHALPVDANGHPLENGKPTYHLYDKQGRKKLDALAWAIQSKINAQKDAESKVDDSPQEGDRNAEGLVFHNGRWHREDDAEVRTAALDDQIDAEEARRLNPESLDRLRAQIESMGGKAKLAEDMRRAFKDSQTRASAEAIVNELASASGLDRDTVLAEMGIKEVTRKPTAERAKPDTLSVGGDYSDDDPNSPNYRFRDTGYISGSRKEEAANMIRQAGRSGQRLRATDIDWQVIEQNPRQAKELITKSNLFGSVDWESLKAGGMEPATGFLIDRIYASIAPEPGVDEPQARKDYAIGLESLRDRLESCKTPEQVTDVLEELKSEFDGVIFNEAEKAAYDKAQAIYREFNTRRWELKKEREDLAEAANNISYQITNLEWQQTKRERRKWKRDPDIDRQIADLRPQQAAALQVIDEWEKAHPEALDTLETRKFVNAEGNQVVETRWHSPLRDMENKAYDTMRDIQAFSLARNREENPLHRAWQLMGQRFINVMKWRGYKGSDSFKNHVTAAKTGKVKDWSWAEKTTSAAPKAGKQKVRFQLRVAENFKRVGGRPVSVDSTAGLKERFNLRDVQSGNWVLSDPESAAFHVQRSSEALSDLADLLGVPDDAVSMNGRVALAFGARGKGNAGFGGAARAHYEPVERVINITKMGGGGALAHELFHAIDNLIREAETGQPGAKDDYVTENPGLLPEGDLKDAVRNLRSAMLEGNQPLWQIIKYTDRDTRLAKHNLERSNPLPVASMIKAAPNLEDALRQLDTYYLARGGWEAPHQKRTAKSRDEWRRIAAAWHDGLNAAGGRVQARVGAPVSDFAYQAHLLDEGQYGKYWSSTHELASRAFQSWCEDRLSDQGRKNDYLSCFADNQYYKDPLFGDSKPFPEGEERARINAAFDGLIAALRQRGTLQKAFMLMAA